MTIANANYEFIYYDVGTNGRVSDGGVIANTKFFERLTSKFLNQGKFRIVINYPMCLSAMKPLDCALTSSNPTQETT